MRQGCLDRRTLTALATGRCPREKLSLVREHLEGCTRCRAAVVSAATGVRGPGETVLLRRPVVRDRRGLKRAAVVVSLLAVVAAWGYGASPGPAVVPLSSVQVQAALRPVQPATVAESSARE